MTALRVVLPVTVLRRTAFRVAADVDDFLTIAETVIEKPTVALIVAAVVNEPVAVFLMTELAVKVSVLVAFRTASAVFDPLRVAFSVAAAVKVPVAVRSLTALTVVEPRRSGFLTTALAGKSKKYGPAIHASALKKPVPLETMKAST
jgi:hypothetical protein